ncbi:penicillin-binding protein, beta-lactamase class C [Mycolicibacterium mageritense DSM 44476 = CIP 104973]|uniref:esterase/beta-lactamase LipL n=1 Tax=Mycolicibacterium mageritense TaxID=53462 RepID=UPI0004336794|nr:serine hydrolase domain-containing protein [Mycolicibacterium mageritense]MCC9182897.1 beta-lactamase family protein [Mycolicibacterium mageritense]CDO22196.1 penicillin-binding protein, beta-lactamase class C [Mycolicibacterium mageritense DSM 44476 = CIP 104973]
MTSDQLLQTDAGLPRGVSGAADPRFTSAVRVFANLFPGRRFGGGALCVYIDGRPVVDIWTGWSDRAGQRLWTADTGAMVFSATKGVAATVIHRLADRGLIDYDAPMAEYWPEFGANGKDTVTVREVLRHRSGLSHLRGVGREQLLDHAFMEERMASAPVDHLRGWPAYHALTFGWLLSGLARAVTGKGMRELIREEVAEPLGTDGVHLGRPPAGGPTQPAQILIPQGSGRANPVLDFVVPKVAGIPFSGPVGAMYFPGVKSLVEGDVPFLDGEVPAANGVVTARGMAKMYGALANGGVIDGKQYLSTELVRSLAGRRRMWPDLNIGVPMAFHLGYHGSPIPGLLRGYGHIGLGGTLGWVDPDTGSAFGYVHNRLISPMVFDMASFAALARPMRVAIEAARHAGPLEVPALGADYPAPRQAATT